MDQNQSITNTQRTDRNSVREQIQVTKKNRRFQIP